MVRPEDSVMVDTWLQIAVVRVYGPWLSPDAPVPPVERKRATGRLQHARAALALRNEQFPVIVFNPPENHS